MNFWPGAHEAHCIKYDNRNFHYLTEDQAHGIVDLPYTSNYTSMPWLDLKTTIFWQAFLWMYRQENSLKGLHEGHCCDYLLVVSVKTHKEAHEIETCSQLSGYKHTDRDLFSHNKVQRRDWQGVVEILLKKIFSQTIWNSEVGGIDVIHVLIIEGLWKRWNKVLLTDILNAMM